MLISQNIRSLTKNKIHLEDVISEYQNIDLICLQEIWNLNPLMDYDLDGFQKPVCSKTRRGGGVAIYVKNGINFKILDNFTKLTENIEIVTCQITNGFFKGIISSIYRPQDSTVGDFCSELRSIITDLKHQFSNNTMYFGGDYNHCFKKVDNQITDLFSNYGFTNSIIGFTRLPSKSSLDGIFTNENLNKYSFRLPNQISDHLAVGLAMSKNTLVVTKNTTKTIRKWDAEQIEKLEIAIEKENLPYALTDCSHIQAFEHFNNTISKHIETHVPKTQIKTKRQNHQPWFNIELRKCRYKLKKLNRKQIQKPTQLNIERYRIARTAYFKNVKTSKNKYHMSKLKKDPKNMKTTWETLRNLSDLKSRKTKEQINQITTEGQTFTTEKDIADHMNNYFATIGTDLAEQIPNTGEEYLVHLNRVAKPTTKFKLHQVNVNEVQKTMRRLKPKMSCSIDNLPTKIMKKLETVLIHPLTILINLSIKHNYVPEEWKTAKVIPIYKSGIKSNPTNYRPISILSCFSKILERTVAKQLMEFIELNSIINKNQFGFRSNHTCQDLLTKLCFILGKNENYKISTTFIDLSKAFDTINTTILIKKLQHYNIDHLWFASYLSNRKQLVSIKDTFSQTKEIITGVPQGSVLGPLLFSLYFNDINTALDNNNTETLLFADDTTIICTGKTLQELENTTNNAMATLDNYLSTNKLTINCTKTKFMLFHTNKNINVQINNTIIEQVHTFKLVGITLDSKLTWNSHIDELMKKLSAVTALLARAKHDLPQELKLLLYNGLFKAFLTYGLAIWGNGSKFIKVARKQKAIIRIVGGKNRLSHSDEIFAKHEQLKANDLLTLEYYKIAKKFQTGEFGKSVQECFSLEAIQTQTKRTNNKKAGNLKQIYFKKHTYDKQVVAQTINVWNLLPEEKQNKKTNDFLIRTKYELINKYGLSKCNNINCYICSLLNTPIIHI